MVRRGAFSRLSGGFCRWRILRAPSLIVFALLLAAGMNAAAQGQGISADASVPDAALSSGAWQQVTVLCPDFADYFDRGINDEYRGCGYELLLAVAQQARWQLRIVNIEDGAAAPADLSFLRLKIGGSEKPEARAAREILRANGCRYSVRASQGHDALIAAWEAAIIRLNAQDPNFEQRLYEKFYENSGESAAQFTQEERAFIHQARPVLVSYDPAWYPLSYRNAKGQFSGAICEMYRRLAEKTGLFFEFRPSDSFTDALAAFASGQTQIMAELPYDFVWAEKHHACLTPPFTSVTVLAAYSPAGSGQLVALPPSYYLQYFSTTIRGDDYSYINLPTINECLDSVCSGKASLTLLNSYQVEFYRGMSRYRQLRYKVLPGYEYGLSIAVSKSANPLLLSIITKGLKAIGTNEINTILRETSADIIESRSVLDIIYSNPLAAVIVFSLAGFLFAAAIGGLLYATALKRKNRQLSEAMNAKSAFLSNMSHDMRTPLNGIIGFTGLALESDDPGQIHNYLEKIKVSGDLLKELITDTLDISRIESGKYILKPEPICVRDLFEEVLVPIRSNAADKKVNLDIDLGGLDSGWVSIDALSARKIILNLLSNAVKFTPAGGKVQLLLSRPEPSGGKFNCCLAVRDTGIGISKDFQSRLFEPFSQENRSSSATGTGLGLSIVKRLVTLMGGTISVQSEPGRGTEFTVLLPVKTVAPPAERRQHHAVDTAAFRGRKLLVCEDNKLNLEIAKTLLEQQGLVVDCAENGALGLRKFQQSPPGSYFAILMDLRMPVMDGYAATAAIRHSAVPEAAAIPIIAMTADAYSDDIQRCLAAGMNGHIPKPIDPENLFRMLAELPDQKTGQQAAL